MRGKDFDSVKQFKQKDAKSIKQHQKAVHSLSFAKLFRQVVHFRNPGDAMRQWRALAARRFLPRRAFCDALWAPGENQADPKQYQRLAGKIRAALRVRHLNLEVILK